MLFEVVKANIINVIVDAIVLPANEHLVEGSGTSRAIFEAAGRKNLAKACKKLGHCKTGSAVPTLAYDLYAKFIIHAVVPKWIDGNSNEYDLLSSAYLTSLKVADLMGCESIAFPLLASGNNGFDKELAAQIAKESIDSFLAINLKKVILVVFSDNTEVFMRGLGYNVAVIPDIIHDDEKKAEFQAKLKKLAADGKNAAQKVLEDQAANAIEWIKEPENQKKVYRIGMNIAQMVLKKREKNINFQ